MADPKKNSKGSNTLVKLLVIAVLGLIVANVGRKWAMSKSDKEFEDRLRRADEGRN